MQPDKPTFPSPPRLAVTATLRDFFLPPPNASEEDPRPPREGQGLAGIVHNETEPWDF